MSTVASLVLILGNNSFVSTASTNEAWFSPCFVLHPHALDVTDPESGDIVNELSGSSSWGDVVYMRDQAQLRHYAFANDRDPDKNVRPIQPRVHSCFAKRRVVGNDLDAQSIIDRVPQYFAPPEFVSRSLQHVFRRVRSFRFWR